MKEIMAKTSNVKVLVMEITGFRGWLISETACHTTPILLFSILNVSQQLIFDGAMVVILHIGIETTQFWATYINKFKNCNSSLELFIKIK